MLKDPYASNLFTENPFVKKRIVKGRLVVVLKGRLENRQLQLIKPISRAVQRGEIHELIITDENQAGPGRMVNSIGYLGFFEIDTGGVLVCGDTLKINNIEIGKIAGFDLTHSPNHLNILVYRSEKVTGLELGLNLEDEVIVERAGNQ